MKTFTIGWLNKCRCGNKSHTVKTARGNETTLWDDDAVKCNSCGRGGVIQVCEGQARVLWETDEEMAEGKPMPTITKERLLTIKQWRETYGPGSNVVLPAEEAEELVRIALASLEAEPVAWMRDDADGREYNARNEFSGGGGGVPLYATPPAPVVPEEKPMPNPLSMLEREITQLIGDAQEATVTGYELIAEAWRLMDGQDPKTSDWHSNASKYLNSNIVEKVDDDRIDAIKAVLRRLAGNSPVTPDGWISCSERMPNEEDVLVYCSDTKEQMVGFHKGKGLFQFFYMNGVEGVCEPSHWMPLPEPPL